MKFWNLLGIIFLVLILAGGVSGSDWVCCMTDTIVEIAEDGSCTGTSLSLPSGATACSEEYSKMYCEKGGKCYNKYEGKFFFDNTAGTNDDRERLCTDEIGGSLVSTDSREDCSNNYEDETEDSSTGGGNDDDGSGGGTGTEVDSGDEEDLNPDGISQTDASQKCGEASFPYNLFYSRNACNAIKNSDGKKACIYNPNSLGKIGFGFTNKGFNITEDYEERSDLFSCRSLLEFDSCLSYKTKKSCENNVVWDRIENSDFKDCAWVDSTDYFSEFDKKGGVCISNFTEKSKHYNIKEYGMRGNMLKDTSFESSDISSTEWSSSNTSLVNIEGDDFAPIGDKVVKISSGEKVSQKISFLSSEVSYYFSIYAKENAGSIGDIKLVVKEYDSSGNVINETGGLLEGQSGNVPTYEKFKAFEQVTVEKGTEVVEVTIKNTGSSAVKIDGVQFIDVPSLGPNSDSAPYREDFGVPPEASACERCYQEYSFNDCTKDKADYLGGCYHTTGEVGKNYSIANGGFDTGDYYGRDGKNPYMAEPWENQAIAKSRLFCGMYLTESECTDSSNYVNSHYTDLHPYSGSTLCKWGTDSSDDEGCYKDSLNTDKPDISSSYFGEDAHENFSKSCDVVPPSLSYVYFYFDNTSENKEYRMTGSGSEIYGNPRIHIKVFDKNNTQCDKFDINRNIKFVYNNTPSNHYEKTEGESYFTYDLSMEEFFMNETSTLLKEGENSVTLKIFDQSANLAYDETHTFKLDLGPPEIDLSFVDNSGPRLTSNSKISISTSDYSKIAKCEYYFSPHNPSEVDSDFYNESSVVETVNNDSFDRMVNVSDFIYNTSVGGAYYVFNINCEDIFGQRNSTEKIFPIDLQTNFVLDEPHEFLNYTKKFGFIDGDSLNFIGYSSDSYLDSCSVTNEETGKTISGDKSSYDGDDDEFNKTINFSIDSSTAPNISQFFKNESNNLTFTCSDTRGNTYSETHEFWYDDENPDIIETSLNISSGDKINKNGKAYTLTETPYLRYYANGTNSWMDANKMSVSMNGTELGYNNLKRSSLNFSHYLSNFTFKPEVNSVAYGESESNDLWKRNYSVTLYDKAGNNVTENFVYYYDNSVPEYQFSGEVSLDAEGGNNYLYTSKSDPQIDFNLSTPGYREFDCNYSINNYKKNEYLPENLGENNSFSFNVENPSNFNLSGKNGVELKLSCTDNYGVSKENTFVFRFDDQAPQFSVIAEPSKKFYKYEAGVVYEEFISDIDINLKNSEYWMNCSYEFDGISNNGIDCLNTVESKQFSDPSGTNSLGSHVIYNNSGSNGACEIESQGKDTYKANLSVTCEDVLGYNYTNSTEVSMMFRDNYLIDLNFSYSEDTVNALLSSYASDENYHYLTNSTDGSMENVSDKLGTFSNPQKEGIVYKYTANVDKADFSEDGKYNVTAALYTNSVDSYPANPLENLTEEVVIDTTSPNVSIGFPNGRNESGRLTVHGSSFNVIYDVEDTLHGIKNISVFVKNSSMDYEKLYEADNLSGYNSSLMESVIENYLDYNPDFDKGMEIYEGYFRVKNFSMNTSYTFKVEAEDLSGNSIKEEQEVYVNDSLAFFAQDSSNAFADITNNWYTNVNAPVINFTTSSETSCDIYPLRSFSDTADPTLSRSLGENLSVFTFNLSTVDDFSLENKSNAYLRMECDYEGDIVVEKFVLSKINYLPDYTIVPQNSTIITSGNNLDAPLKVDSKRGYPPIHCKYGFSENAIDNHVGESDEYYNTKEFRIDLNGKRNLTKVYYQCSDKTENKGFKKEVSYYVGIDDEFNITELYLEGRETGNIYEASDGKVYIQDENVDLRFVSNKGANKTDCSYEIVEKGLMDQTVNFFQDLLFDIGYDEIEEGSNAFEYGAGNLEFEDEETTLDVVCTILKDDGSALRTNHSAYEVHMLNSTDLSYDINMK